MSDEYPHCMAREEYRYGRNFGLVNIDSFSYYISTSTKPHVSYAWLVWEKSTNTLDVRLVLPPRDTTRPPKGERRPLKL